MWPQIVILVIVMIGLIINIINEGEPKDVNFDTMNYIIKYGFILFVLYKGGFFDCFFHAN
jgi:hypothetical protein